MVRLRYKLCVQGILACYLSVTFLYLLRTKHPRVRNKSTLSKISQARTSRQLLSTTASTFSDDRWRISYRGCEKLIAGDKEEFGKAHVFMKEHPSNHSGTATYKIDCDEFLSRTEHQIKVSDEEENFPIAYTILVHDSPSQLERLLRTIYRRHNVYCIHVDRKASAELMDVASTFQRCLPNIFLPSQRETVVYASHLRLQAELNCISELLVKNIHWKYLINLTGQMFPLKTNLQIVRILKTYNGFNDVEMLSSRKLTAVAGRYATKHVITGKWLRKTEAAKEPLPHNIRLVKGSAYGSFSRPFLEYIFTDQIVKDFLTWCKDIYSPDEVFWATLNNLHLNPMFHSPGGHNLTTELKPWFSSYSAWQNVDRCHGRFVRFVCIFGIEDLPYLVSRVELFANKFYEGYQHLALDCLEEYLRNKSIGLLSSQIQRQAYTLIVPS